MADEKTTTTPKLDEVLEVTLSREANMAGRAINTIIESTYNVVIKWEDCMKIMILVQGAIDVGVTVALSDKKSPSRY